MELEIDDGRSPDVVVLVKRFMELLLVYIDSQGANPGCFFAPESRTEVQ